MARFYDFPDPMDAPDFAPLASGGDLSEDCLLSAYSAGIFPWFNEDEPILWWSPDPRAVLDPREVRVQKSIKPYLKRYEVKFDANFKGFIERCKDVRKKESDGTWISEQIVQAYSRLAADRSQRRGVRGRRACGWAIRTNFWACVLRREYAEPKEQRFESRAD